MSFPVSNVVRLNFIDRWWCCWMVESLLRIHTSLLWIPTWMWLHTQWCLPMWHGASKHREGQVVGPGMWELGICFVALTECICLQFESIIYTIYCVYIYTHLHRHAYWIHRGLPKLFSKLPKPLRNWPARHDGRCVLGFPPLALVVPILELIYGQMWRKDPSRTHRKGCVSGGGIAERWALFPTGVGDECKGKNEHCALLKGENDNFGARWKDRKVSEFSHNNQWGVI